MPFNAADAMKPWSAKASLGANIVMIVERLRKFISRTDTIKQTPVEPLPLVKDQEPSPSGLEQTIATYKTHFGDRWKEAFFATAKVNVSL